mmetsp:Transcript_19706/g.58636  ORF Transcript_19706/g.58636 Transcript_19706/m.58636 type:complete len:247 (+) Transcript_19706:2362-3102(+)
MIRRAALALVGLLIAPSVLAAPRRHTFAALRPRGGTQTLGAARVPDDVFGAARAPRGALRSALAVRGGGEAKALSPERSGLGALLAAIRAFIASFFDPAFGGDYGVKAAPAAPSAAAPKPAARARTGGSRTITVDDLKQMEGGRVVAVKTDAELSRSVASSKLSVVDFWASWCGPCVQMKPKFAKISDRYRGVGFYAVDVDAAKAVSQKHQVSSMPTFVFFKGGKELDRFSGADENKLATLIERYQ